VKTTRRKSQVRYSSLNKRVRSLEESGYIKSIGVKKTKAGFEATIYDLTAKAYLATLLNTINLNELINQTDETTATQILTDILFIINQKTNN
jgi:hypothetical protein